MSDESIPLSRQFKFFLTFHFSLGFSIEYSDDPKDQLSKLDVIAEGLNKEYKFLEYKWSVQEFTESYPLSLQKKYGYLLGKWMGSTEELQKIIDTRFNECDGVKLVSGSIKETVVYFDHGVGSVNLVFKGELTNVDAIKCFRDLALKIQRDIQYREEKVLRVFNEWDDFRDSMGQAFGSSLYDIWGIRLLGDKGREPTRVVGTGVLFSIDKNSNLGEFELKQVKKTLSGFAGSEPAEHTDIEGIKYLAEGYDGNIALVSDAKQEDWLFNLWQFITDHYTLVRDLERYLYDWALSQSKEEQTFDSDYVHTVLEAIRRIELSINMITYEILPQNFAGVGDEKKVCEGIYDKWHTQTTVNSLNDKFKTLNTRFNYYYTFLEQKAQEKSNKIQTRINYIVFILTTITLASVLSDIFLFTYDGSSLIDIFKKAKIILIPTFIFAVLCWFSIKKGLKENN